MRSTRLSVAVLMLLIESVSSLRVTPMAMQQQRTRVAPLSMRTPVEEEKKGFSLANLFGGGKSATEGKVVPTGKGEKGEEELDENKKLLQKVKDAGVAGIISYVFWEWAFWGISIPVCIFGYYEVTGHWPDLSNAEDQAKLGAEAFAFVNVARFAIPLRIGLALSTTPWVQNNIVDKFQKKDA